MSYKFNLRHDLSIDDHQMKCVFSCIRQISSTIPVVISL